VWAQDGHRVLGRLLRYNDERRLQRPVVHGATVFGRLQFRTDGKVNWRKLLTRERPRLALAPTSLSRRQPLGGS
jgi:hypothetical protein